MKTQRITKRMQDILDLLAATSLDELLPTLSTYKPFSIAHIQHAVGAAAYSSVAQTLKTLVTRGTLVKVARQTSTGKLSHYTYHNPERILTNEAMLTDTPTPTRYHDTTELQQSQERCKILQELLWELQVDYGLLKQNTPVEPTEPLVFDTTDYKALYEAEVAAHNNTKAEKTMMAQELVDITEEHSDQQDTILAGEYAISDLEHMVETLKASIIKQKSLLPELLEAVKEKEALERQLAFNTTLLRWYQQEPLGSITSAIDPQELKILKQVCHPDRNNTPLAGKAMQILNKV